MGMDLRCLSCKTHGKCKEGSAILPRHVAVCAPRPPHHDQGGLYDAVLLFASYIPLQGQDCSIFLGISERSIVRGFQMNRTDRDNLRVGIHQALRRLHPPLVTGQFKVIFHNVYQSADKLLPDVYVVGELVLIMVTHFISLDPCPLLKTQWLHFMCTAPP